MTRANQVRARGVVERFSDVPSRLQAPGDYVLIVRGVPRAIVMACPDGCGENITVNLDRRVGPAWRKYEKASRLTVYPSVWRESGCGAHFIIWHDRIIWCGPNENYSVKHDDAQLEALVLANLSADTYIHYESIADAIDKIPWEVNWACKNLVNSGRAVQGKIGTYRRVGKSLDLPKSGRIDYLA